MEEGLPAKVLADAVFVAMKAHRLTRVAIACVRCFGDWLQGSSLCNCGLERLRSRCFASRANPAVVFRDPWMVLGGRELLF